MDVNKLCFGCMKEKENPGQRCPRCGFDINEYMQNCSARVLRPGTILNGQYLVGKVLGEGGFGITYLAMDLNLEMQVAIKEYFPAGLAVRDASERSITRISVLSGEKSVYYQQGLERFTEEAKSLIRFRYEEGIVQVNTLFYENGTAYMVMEYIHGKSLKQYLQEKNAPLTEAETFRIMMPILKMLEKVHEAGIIHRDISPDNIMLGENGKVYLIDFGAARMITGAESKSLDVVLKPGYTPFEQYYSRGNMGPWTDVYAVCATMYRMMSGRVPQESLARIDRDQQETLYALSEKREIPSVSQRTSKVVEKGMSLKTEDRYQDLGILLKELNGSEKILVREQVKPEFPESQNTQFSDKSDATISKTDVKKIITYMDKRDIAMICGLIFLIFLTMWLGVSATGTPDMTTWNKNAMEYYNQAKKGDIFAQLKIGRCYLYGENGVIKNEKQAVAWYQKAAKQGNEDAEYMLGHFYYTGTGVEQDYEMAAEWFEKAAEQGNLNDQYNLGCLYYKGEGVSQNYESAFEWFRKAAMSGKKEAQNNLSVFYRDGIVVKKNLEMAEYWFQKAKESGLTE